MSHEALMDDLKLWRELGWIRMVDEHLANFLATLEPGADERVLLAAAMTSHLLGKGHVCLGLDDWLADPLEHLELPPEEPERERDDDPGRQRKRERALERLGNRLQGLDRDSLEQALTDSPLVASSPDDASGTPLVFDRGNLYLRRTWRAETGIAASILQRINPQAAAAVSADVVGDAVRAVFGGDGRSLPQQPQTDTDWQQVACALAARGRFTVITGGPGTGKTWTVVRVIALLQLLNPDQATHPLRIRLAAPTGKAAQRLSESIKADWATLQSAQTTLGLVAPEPASTLHRLLGSQYHSRHFRHHRANPLPADVVIVDEASMIDQELMHCLLEALAPETRLILVGDKDQLSSVDPGSVFGDLCGNAGTARYSNAVNDWLSRAVGFHTDEAAGTGGLADCCVMLRRNWRSTPAINELAAAVNRGDDEQAVRLLCEDASGELEWPMVNADDRKTLKPILCDGYLKYLRAVEEARPRAVDPQEEEVHRWARQCLKAYARFQVLTAHKKGDWGVAGLNRQIRDWLRKHQIHGQSAIDEGEWYHGRPVMITKNDYSTGLMNGDIGLCLEVPDKGKQALKVAFAMADNSIRYFGPSRLPDCETAWAMTVHKSQGSEFTHTVLVLPDQPSRVLTRELVYTGLTRARERFTLLALNEQVFRQAVRSRTQRSSSLAERIAEPSEHAAEQTHPDQIPLLHSD
ncbi:MAG: exodeoxyribonuclease V subunit alpha [Wenzhouxiangellaceae bacterium]|nr:exodeoxyribonuclease V subunit alpha [Wenzhouxiangellaceae bacterium]